MLSILLGASLGAAADQKLYTCSMHPQIIRTAPGSCPICGMDLTLMVGGAAGSGDALSAIHIDTRTVQMMNLRTQVLERAAAQRNVRTLGVVAFDETSLADITTRYDGWIEKLYANKSWQRVKQGEPLFEIYSPALYNAQLNYLVALRSEGEKGGTLTEASLERLRLLGVSDAFIAELGRRGEAQRNYIYPAPQDGIIVDKMVVQGQKVMAGETIFRIADIARVWVEAQVFEKDLPLVKQGQIAAVRTTADGEVLAGVVAQVLPRVQDATRSGTARILLDNPQGALLPGMFAEASIAIALADAALLVPDEAVLRSGAGNSVFVAQEDGSFIPREVELGARTDDHRYIVRSGLEEGERVVVSGQFMLDSESRLREAIRKMTEAATGKGGSADASAAAEHEHCDSHTGAAHAHNHAAQETTASASAGDNAAAGAVAGITLAASGENGSTASSSPAAAQAELKALGLAAADTAVALAADDIVGHAETLPALNAALKAYFESVGTGAPAALGTYAKGDGLPLRSTLAQARDDFAPFSNALSDAVRASGLNRGSDLHVFECPMVPKVGTGRWLQRRSDEVANPFFGASMLTCGGIVR